VPRPGGLRASGVHPRLPGGGRGEVDRPERGRPPRRLPDEEGLDDEGPRLPDPHRHRRQLPLRPGRAVEEEAGGEARA